MDNTVKLLSSDNEEFEVEVSVVQECKTLKTMIEEMGTKDAIFLETVCSKVLAQVIEYCQYHAALHIDSDGNSAIPENGVTKWNAEFINVDRQSLVDLIQAANFLNIESLVKLACRAVADMMVDKSAEEICGIFNIKNLINDSTSTNQTRK